MAGLRAPHGNKPHTSVEVVADELTPIEPQLANPNVDGKAFVSHKVGAVGATGGRVALERVQHPNTFQKGNPLASMGGKAAQEKAARLRRESELIKSGKKAPKGVKQQVFFKHPDADEDYQYFTHLAKRYYKHRLIELSQINQGPVSAAVCNILQSAAWCLLASRWMNYEASKPANAKQMLELITRASTMGEKARQHELAAWELNAREVKSRPKKIDPSAYMSGFFEKEDGTVGEVKANQGWTNGPAVTEIPGQVTAYLPHAGALNREGQEIRRGRGRPRKDGKPSGPPTTYTTAAHAFQSDVKIKAGQTKQSVDVPSILDIEQMPDNPLGVDIDATLAHGYDPGKKDIT